MNMLVIAESTFKYLFEKYRIAAGDLWAPPVQKRRASRDKVTTQSYTTNTGYRG